MRYLRYPALLLGLLAAPAFAQKPVPAPPSSAVPSQPVPAPPPAPAAKSHVALDELLGALAAAPTDELASAIDARLRALWLSQATPAVRLLFNRGMRELQADSPADAADDLAAATDLQPDFAMGWAGRAQAELQRGADAAALRAIEQAVQHEPRFYPAFSLLAAQAEQRKDWKGAFNAWQKVMEIYPRIEGGAARLLDLRRHAFGDET